VYLLALSTLAFLAGLVITYWLHNPIRFGVIVSPEAVPPSFPSISVIVPARDEARNIQRCIEALLAQDYPDYEVIVVDDRSTDATPHLLDGLLEWDRSRVGRDARPHSAEPVRLKVLHGVELPEGWAGKPHALAQGAQIARGEWLCFMDADTFARPGLLRAAIAAAQEQGADLLSLLTDQELGSFWERTVLPLVMTGLSVGFPIRRVNDPSKPDAVAFGQFIMIRCSVYQAVGGYSAIRDQIVEDKAIAEIVKGNGFHLVLGDGRLAASTRLYTSLPEMWEGWTKNIYLGMRERLGFLAFGAFVGLVAALVLPAWLLGGLYWCAAGGGVEAALFTAQAALLWACLLWARARAARLFHISPWYAFTLPLGALVFTSMMAASALKILFRSGVTWKGRRYYGRT
jgi:chlorobactene glucosyltransferase